MKRALLEGEGVRFDVKGRVTLEPKIETVSL